MIRVYFVFEDPFDDAEANLSFVDVPTREPGKAMERLQDAARSGELWRLMYPDDEDHPYALIRDKVSYLDISALPHAHSKDTLLPI
jgi:hypothetical protein